MQVSFSPAATKDSITDHCCNHIFISVILKSTVVLPFADRVANKRICWRMFKNFTDPVVNPIKKKNVRRYKQEVLLPFYIKENNVWSHIARKRNYISLCVKCVFFFSVIPIKIRICDQLLLKKTQLWNFLKISPVGSQLLHTDSRMDIVRLEVGFHNSFADKSKYYN